MYFYAFPREKDWRFSVPPCPPLSLFKWRSCSFGVRPHPSAVLYLKAADLEREPGSKEPGSLLQSLSLQTSVILKNNLLIDIFPQSIQVSCLIASTGRPLVTYHFWLVETIS